MCAAAALFVSHSHLKQQKKSKQRRRRRRDDVKFLSHHQKPRTKKKRERKIEYALYIYWTHKNEQTNKL